MQKQNKKQVKNKTKQNKTKQSKLFEGKDGQDDAHVGATSPSLGVSTSW